jgi:elongation factor Ts
MDVKKALDEARGDEKKAEEILKERGAQIMEKKADREAQQGLIDCYLHLGKIGCLVEVNCETDFVARNEDFRRFAHEVALQVASSEAKSVAELLKEPYFKDPTRTVEDLVRDIIAKIGENVKIKRFVKYTLGK